MGDVTYLNAHRTGDPLQWRQHSLAGGGLGRRWRPAVGRGICGAQRCRRMVAPVTGSQCVAALWQGGVGVPRRRRWEHRRRGRDFFICFGCAEPEWVEEFSTLSCVGLNISASCFGPMILLLAAHTRVLLGRHLHSCPV